jgi:iron complex outermembrane recepter protein
MSKRLQWWVLALSSGLVLEAAPVKAESAEQPPVLRVQDLPRSATTVKDWLSQQPETTAPIRVTDVRLNPTQQGLEVVLQTETGQSLQVSQRSQEETLILTVPNAVLALSNGQAFEAEKPIEGIDRVTVTQVDATTIQVSIAGVNDLPTADVVPGQGLVLAVIPEAGEEEEITVTGEGQRGYRVPNASTATRTDTPIRDIPQSIQVVPQEVLREQRINNTTEALRNVTGVTQFSASSNITTPGFTIRGFTLSDFSGNVLRNGLRSPLANYAMSQFGNIERVEVLKGPGSVLFGQGVPGGIINLVTKQPLRDPYYSVEATIGSYDFYRGSVDLSGPLNRSRTALYRLNVGYRNSDNFFDFGGNRSLLIAPVLSLQLGRNTKLTVEGDYADVEFDSIYPGLPAIGTIFRNPNGKIPRNRNINDASFAYRVGRVGYRLEQQLSSNWSLNNAFQVEFFNPATPGEIFYPLSLASDVRTLNRGSNPIFQSQINTYILATDIIGKFTTGSIEHQLLFGFELSRYDTGQRSVLRTAGTLDLFNPVYSPTFGDIFARFFERTVTDGLGIYVQDQIKLAENLKLLLGGRYNGFEENYFTDIKTSQSGNAFSPRIGIVYQPIPPISLYASYSRSFNPVIGTALDGSQFQPERGTQYEVGIKADLNSRLSTTLAFYDLKRSNVLTDDPVNPNFSIQTGEQRSRGIELSVQGEILPGWNIIAGYAYTDAEVTADNRIPVGNALVNAPRNSANLWTTYEIQRGSLQGLGFGVGIFFVGERQGDLANTFEVPSYVRVDSSIFYRRNNFRVGLNFKNLFDVEYFEAARSNVRVLYGAPFTVQGTISYTF